MNTIVIASFPLNRLSVARCYSMQRIFKDRNLVVPIRNKLLHSPETITEILNDPDIIKQWNIEYLQGPRPIDEEFMKMDYERYIKKFLGSVLEDT